MSAHHIEGRLAPDVKLTVSPLIPRVSGRSAHQTYEISESATFGRLYALDGDLMATEADEYCCHESLVHVAAITHLAPRRALVLGGGDGGTTRELLRHPTMEQVLVAELDAEVLAVNREHLGAIHRGVFDDRRVAVRIGDALDYVYGYADSGAQPYDLIIFDLTDAAGAAAPLHSVDFFHACRRCLSKDGAVVVQLGSPFYHRDSFAALAVSLGEVFGIVRPYRVDVPSYGGSWGMAVASDSLDPAVLSPNEIERRLCGRRISGLRHYNGDIHRAQFALPNDLRDQLAARGFLARPLSST